MGKLSLRVINFSSHCSIFNKLLKIVFVQKSIGFPRNFEINATNNNTLNFWSKIYQKSSFSFTIFTSIRMYNFRVPGHSYAYLSFIPHSYADLSFIPIEKIRSRDSMVRKVRESYYIQKFNSVRSGLNKKT